MNEAELIEVSNRFRKLSDKLDEADVYLKECEKKEKLIAALRADLYSVCVQCSEDLDRMQALIRKQAK
jgi:hypothetical protein